MKHYEQLENDIKILLKIAYAVHELPFGEIPALPWCRESFPKLDNAMKEWEKYKESSLDNLSFLEKKDL